MGSWSTAGDLNNAVEDHAGCGLYNATLSFGGNDRITNVDITEEYNGTAWTTVNTMVTATKDNGGAGTQSAALSIGGYVALYVASTESYDGTTWSTDADLNNAVYRNASCGTQSAAVSFGGDNGDPVVTTEEFNGTVWSSGGDLSQAVFNHGGVGTQTASLSFGGDDGADFDKTEEYNGTAWSAGGNLNNGIQLNAGGGEQTAAISFGGEYGETTIAITEEYNGTAWALGGDLITERDSLAGAGTKSLGLAFGGYNTGATASVATESYSIIYGQHKGISGIDGGVLFAGKTIIGDRTNGKLYYLDMDTYTDNGELIKRTRRTQIINKEASNVIHNRIEVEFEPGVGLDVAEGQDGYDPQAVLRWSDDDGNTWSDERSVSIGEYQSYGARALWRGLGKSRNRIYELTITEPVKIVLIGAYGKLKACKF